MSPLNPLLVKEGCGEPSKVPHSFTGMAQRERAGLITPRTQDQNLLPVFILRKLYRSCHGDNRQVGGCLSPLLALNSVYSAAELGQ